MIVREMKMKKIIKKYGSTLIIRLDPEDLQIYDLKEGDILEIEFKKIGEKNDD